MSMLHLVPEVPTIAKLPARATYAVTGPRATQVAQVKPWRRLRATGGALVGAFVPCAVFALVHWGMDHSRADWYWNLRSVFALGGLIFSAKTVFTWTSLCFARADGSDDKVKGFGFTLLTEAIMTFCGDNLMPLAFVALGFLVAINAVESARTAAR